jgi:hypothetical protein
MMLRSFAWFSGAVLGLAVAQACGDTAADGDCTVGGRGCQCTPGGGCDPELSCIDGVCVLLPGDSNSSTAPGTESDSATDSDSDPSTDPSATNAMTSLTTSASTSADDTTDTTDATDDGPVLDVGNADTGPPKSGCTAMDILFVLDSSGSMIEERQALAATNAFTQIITTLDGINGGGVDYRIGVTDDNDHGFFTPAGWVEPNPWFESTELDTMAMANAFNGAVTGINNVPATPAGCEHVLTSATDLLVGDGTGFVREGALLVLVLVTDVDDYGAYDQVGGHSCGDFFPGCGTPPANTPEEIADILLTTVKGGLAGSVAGVVVAGDPNVLDGVNFCDQPGSCGCNGADCGVFHADRLWAFVDAVGDTALASDLCNVTVPMAVQSALADNIDLACMNLEPEG